MAMDGIASEVLKGFKLYWEGNQFTSTIDTIYSSSSDQVPNTNHIIPPGFKCIVLPKDLAQELLIRLVDMRAAWYENNNNVLEWDLSALGKLKTLLEVAVR